MLIQTKCSFVATSPSAPEDHSSLMVGRPCWACTGASGLICFVILVLDVVLITWNTPVDPVAGGTSSQCCAPTLVALPTRPNDCDCNMVRCVQALCNSVSTGNGKNAEDTAPFGANQQLQHPEVPRGLAQCLAVLPRPRSWCFVFTALLPRHRLAAKTEHPVQLNQESLPFNSPRTLSFIILSFSCFYTCKYLIKRNYQQNFSGACRFLFDH